MAGKIGCLQIPADEMIRLQVRGVLWLTPSQDLGIGMSAPQDADFNVDEHRFVPSSWRDHGLSIEMPTVPDHSLEQERLQAI